MTSLELLAPAKNLACGMAAIDHGADAVYIGASRFGARSAAGNSIDDIRQLCRYAHPFGAKVYVTVNTILYDDELDGARRLLAELQDIGVDAVLVQDMAILSWRVEGGGWRENTPSADSAADSASEHISLHTPPSSLHENPSTLLTPRLHASTQTDNRTVEKVRWLRDLGFSRVVLARELSVEEIATIHREVPDVELEVFVHGALCVSYSGLCYASQYCFHRSANRGECAQFCRMKFSLVDGEGREVEHDRYLLSLKDLNQSDHLEELIEAGATSFKIEGRLKDVNYVKNVTAAYSQRLNEIVRRHPDKYRRSSLGECRYTFTPDLRKTFNRGYTTYFLHGRQPDIASFDTPKAIGEYVGTVKELRGDSFNVAGTASFANGDGLCFFIPHTTLHTPHATELVGFRANKVVGNRIWPYRMPQGLRPGVRLYRNNDQEFERLLSKPSAKRKIPVTLAISAFDDDGFAPGFQLKISNGKYTHAVRIHAEHQMALKSQREQIVRELSKLGNTPYRCERVDIPDDFDYFIPASRLSELRRFAVDSFGAGNHGDCPYDRSVAEIRGTVPMISNPYPYLYNISNHLSQQFYGAPEKTAYELKPATGPIMQCRHCIRYALGYCVKRGGQHPTWREPLSLVLGDGRRFRLEFDCKNCQMNVYAP
ncbi:MAG: U32 family peptidase [Prevotella sp.]|nr:U32 family peptidase [Prevotella sp.]